MMRSSLKKLRPNEHYVDALLLVKAQEQGIETVGPPRLNSSWQKRTEGAYTLEQFQIDWRENQVTCPKGKTSRP